MQPSAIPQLFLCGTGMGRTGLELGINQTFQGQVGRGELRRGCHALKMHAGRLACQYLSPTIRAIISQMMYSSVTQSCCQLRLSLWVVADGSARAKKEEKKNHQQHRKLNRSEPFADRKGDRASCRWLRSPSFMMMNGQKT